MLAAIVVVAALAIYIALPTSPGFHFSIGSLRVDQDFPIREGLDLKGGIQVLLQADESSLPPGSVTATSMQAAERIVEQRVNALGVSEPLVQIGSGNRIIVQLPGVKDPDQAIKTFGQTGLLEVVDAGSTGLPVGTTVTTSLGGPSTVGAPVSLTPSASTTVTPGTTASPAASGTVASTATAAGTATAPATGTAASTGTAVATGTPSASGTPAATPGAASPTPAPQVYTNVLSGKDLQSASVGFDQYNRPQINFVLNPDGAKKFGDYTTKNVGKYLAITMDKKVINSAVIQEPITGGRGVINGIPSLQEAQSVVIQLQYGALPIPLKVVDSTEVGPTLGAQAVRQSVTAGLIGLGIVLAFMLLYYRAPGLLADVALLIYAAVTFALFRLIPVTLTLAGIAGFILSIGMAVDANILIFERMKEEIRAGRTLHGAIDAGFARAWTSIRDSNFSTLITCAILYWFGSTFGASIIQGFALTLAIGVIISLFTAVLVSRTFVQLLVEIGRVRDLRWYGLDKASLPAAPPKELVPS
jgi:preprotein translocase subunit SecD